MILTIKTLLIDLVMLQIHMVPLPRDKWQDDIPASLAPFLSIQQRKKSWTCAFTDKDTEQLVFIVRFYRTPSTSKLSKSRGNKKNMDINNIIQCLFEVGDVWLAPDYRGKMATKTQKYARYCFGKALAAFWKKETHLPLFLWTTEDNYAAIHTYQHFGFKNVECSPGMQSWVAEHFPWLKARNKNNTTDPSIVCMIKTPRVNKKLRF